MERSQLRLLRSIVFKHPQRCDQCLRQTRYFRTTPFLRKEREADIQLEPITSTPTPKPQSSPYKREIAPERLDENFVPQPLGAPIGIPYPPHPGEDAVKAPGREKLSDWHLSQREKLKKEFSTSYFKDFRNLNFHNGKFYTANPRLFKESVSLYFPNLRGVVPSRAENHSFWPYGLPPQADTTFTLKGKISIISVFSRLWALNQTMTFVGDKNTQNPEIGKLVEENPELVQRVQLNFEEQNLFYATLRMTVSRNDPSLRNHFILKGIAPEIKESLAMMNDKVGYIFLVDQTCKVRWAACGEANDDEKVSLVKGVRKLVEDARQK